MFIKKASSVTFQNLLKLIAVDKIRYIAVQFTKVAGYLHNIWKRLALLYFHYFR